MQQLLSISYAEEQKQKMSLEIEKLQELLQNCQKSNELLTVDINIKDSSIKLANTELSDTKLEADTLRRQIEDLDNEKNSLISQINDLKLTTSNLEVKIQDQTGLEATIKSLKDQLKPSSSSTSIDFNSDQVNSLNSEILVLKTKLQVQESLEVDLTAARKTLSLAEEMNRRYKSAIEKEKKSIESFKNNIEELNKTISVNEVELQRQVQMNVVNKETLSLLQSKFDDSQQIIQKLESKDVDAQLKISTLTQDLHKASELLEFERHQANNALTLSSKIEKYEIQISQLQQELDDIRQQLSSQLEMNQFLETKEKEFVSQIDKLEQISEKARMLEIQVATQEEALIKNESQLVDLANIISKLREELSKSNQEANSLRKNMETKDVQLQSINQNLEEMKAAIVHRTVENASLHETIHRLQALEKTLTSDKNQLLDQMNALKLDVSTFRQQSKDLEFQVETLSEELKFTQESNSKYEKESSQISEYTQKYKSLEEEYVKSQDLMRSQSAQLIELFDKLAHYEDLIAKSNDKKKRDLELLRKQNEQIGLLQRERGDAEMKYEARIASLEASLKLIQSESESISYTSKSRIEELERLALEKDQTIERLQQDLSINSNESVNSTSSYEVVSPLESKTLEKLSIPIVITDDNLSEILELKSLVKAKDEDINQLKESLKEKEELIISLEGNIENNHIKISQIDEERIRLEKEVKYYELSYRRNIENFSIGPTTRTRGDNSNDIEAPSDQNSEFNVYEFFDYKRDEIGVHPYVIKLWDLFRRYIPFILTYIGERPPRLTMQLQLMIVYVVILHILAIYEYFYPSYCATLS